jgi:hypothetical protein
MILRAGVLVMTIGLSSLLAACGDKPEAKPDSSANAASTSKATATAKASSAPAAAASAVPGKKDDSGW